MWYDCFEASVEKTHGKNIKREKINMKIPFATDRHEIVKDGDTYEVKKGQRQEVVRIYLYNNICQDQFYYAHWVFQAKDFNKDFQIDYIREIG